MKVSYVYESYVFYISEGIILFRFKVKCVIGYDD